MPVYQVLLAPDASPWVAPFGGTGGCFGRSFFAPRASLRDQSMQQNRGVRTLIIASYGTLMKLLNDLTRLHKKFSRDDKPNAFAVERLIPNCRPSDPVWADRGHASSGIVTVASALQFVIIPLSDSPARGAREGLLNQGLSPLRG
jgi:hypothetical protein